MHLRAAAKAATIDTGLTETVYHHVSQSGTRIRVRGTSAWSVVDEEISKYTGVVGRGLSTRAGWDEDVASLYRLLAKKRSRCDKLEHVAPVLQAVPLQLPSPASQQWLGARALVLQPGGSGGTRVDMVDAEPHLKALTQHIAGRVAVLCLSAAAQVDVLMHSGLGIIVTSEELVEAFRRWLAKMPTALLQAFVGHTRVVASLGQEWDIVTQSFPLHLTIGTP